MENNTDLDDSCGWQPTLSYNSAITDVSSGSIMRSDKELPINTIVLGEDNMFLGGDYSFIIGTKNTMPYGAYNCGIIGSNVHLTHDNVLKDAIYLGSCKQDLFISKCNDWFGVLDKIEKRLEPLLSKGDAKKEAAPRIMIGGETEEGKEEFIDLKAKIEELEEKLNMLLYAPGGPFYVKAEKSFNTAIKENSSPSCGEALP